VLDGPAATLGKGWSPQLLETMSSVAAYVKERIHQGSTIRTRFQGRSRQYCRISGRPAAAGGRQETRDVIIEVSGQHKPPGPTTEKADDHSAILVARGLITGGFGRWSYCALKDRHFRPSRRRRSRDLYHGIGCERGSSPWSAPTTAC